MSDKDKWRSEDDESESGGESLLPVPCSPIPGKTIFWTRKWHLHLTICVLSQVCGQRCTREEAVYLQQECKCLQAIPTATRERWGWCSRNLSGIPQKNAADPTKSPKGLLCTSFYSQEEGDRLQARDEEQMEENLQNDSSESKRE